MKILSSETNNLWFPWMELISLSHLRSPVTATSFLWNAWRKWTLTCGDFTIQNKSSLNRKEIEGTLPLPEQRFYSIPPKCIICVSCLLWKHFIAAFLFLWRWACSCDFSVTESLFLNITLWLWQEVLSSQSYTHIYATSFDLWESNSHIRASALGP